MVSAPKLFRPSPPPTPRGPRSFLQPSISLSPPRFPPARRNAKPSPRWTNRREPCARPCRRQNPHIWGAGSGRCEEFWGGGYFPRRRPFDGPKLQSVAAVAPPPPCRNKAIPALEQSSSFAPGPRRRLNNEGARRAGTAMVPRAHCRRPASATTRIEDASRRSRPWAARAPSRHR